MHVPIHFKVHSLKLFKEEWGGKKWREGGKEGRGDGGSRKIKHCAHLLLAKILPSSIS